MASPFLGQIMTFGGNFAPRNYAFCNGQILSIAQNTALFALLGTTYGGNGQTTFALPDLRGRAMVHTGTGPGLSPYTLGQVGGVESVTLLSTQMPAHNHPATFTPTGQPTVGGVNTKGTSATPSAGALLGRAADGAVTPAAQPRIYAPAGSTPAVGLGGINVAGTVTIASNGSSTPFSILKPFLAVSVCIATAGIFPSRN